MEIKERIAYLIKLNQLTASSFANKIGAQPSSISHIISGRNKPSLDLIQKILNEFPKVDPAWLINGVKKSEQVAKVEHQSYNKSNEAIQTTNVEKEDLKTESRKLIKVMLFYDDNTVEEFKHQ